MCICVLCVCLDVNQGGTNHNHCTQETCYLACTDLLMNPDLKPKPGWPDLLYRVLGRHRKNLDVHYLCKLLTYGHEICTI